MTEVADRTTASVRHSRTSASIRSAGGKRAVFILVIVAMLLTIGLGAMLSASSVASIKANGDQFELFTKQVMWVALGMTALVLTSFIPYRIWQRLALVMFLATILGLIATLVVGSTRGGATRWIVVGPVTLQVAEFAKFATIALVATALSKKEALLSDVRHLLAPLAVILLPLIFLLLAQPDFGTVLLILGPVFVMLFASSVPVGFVFSLGVIGAAAMGAAAMAAPYRKARLLSFLDPFASAGGDGFQAVQSMVAFGTGGLFGVGLGQSRARWSWLPNAHTDFIFAIIGEETGFAGAFIVITLFTLLAAVGVSVAYRAPDTFGRLLAIGIVSWMTLQAIINIGGVVAVLPITGVPLPFISSGGNAMLVNLAAIGVLLNIARTSNVLDTENV
jgi:cell division protein FtsW